MSAPKLYLIIIRNAQVTSINSYREIDTLVAAWTIRTHSDCTGLIHCGFMRPQISLDENLIQSLPVEGKMLYTGALKWSLPKSFNASKRPVYRITIDDKLVPCYLALNHWGYECSDESSPDVDSPCNLDSTIKPTTHQETQLGGTSNAVQLGVRRYGHKEQTYFPDEHNEPPKSLLERTEQIPLNEHLEATLSVLNESDRFILHARLGYSGRNQTLKEIAHKLNITRERVRQRQKKYTTKIIETEYWDDVIGIRVGQLLNNRTEPLILEMLDFEDSWFKGFVHYNYLANVIQMFSENAIQVINAHGDNVVTRITQTQWNSLLKELKPNLKEKASEGCWTRRDIHQLYESHLTNFSSVELTSILENYFDEHLHFENSSEDAILLSYGRSIESTVAVVLKTAEKPLHYVEIMQRTAKRLGREVDLRRVHNAVASQNTWLFGRGTYGLIEHCPLSDSQRIEIRELAEKMLLESSIHKQWHSNEIINSLRQEYQTVPDSLDPYVLRMCLGESDKIVFLNRMVWARADSGLKKGDRLQVLEMVVEILEEAGIPLSGRELKRRISARRGISENMQIHASGRLFAVEPNVWGLVGRDD